MSTSIDWYAEGQSRTVEVGGVRTIIRFVGRRGRRARIAIEAPAGRSFVLAERGLRELLQRYADEQWLTI